MSCLPYRLSGRNEQSIPVQHGGRAVNTRSQSQRYRRSDCTEICMRSISRRAVGRSVVHVAGTCTVAGE